jgi:hypothetical protein
VVAHAGQLRHRHDGARRILAGLFQLDSIATDPALGSNPALDLHESGFAAAVRPDQPIAIPAAELHGDVREQGLGPELHGDTGGDDHFEVLEIKKPAAASLGWV